MDKARNSNIRVKNKTKNVLPSAILQNIDSLLYKYVFEDRIYFVKVDFAKFTSQQFGLIEMLRILKYDVFCLFCAHNDLAEFIILLGVLKLCDLQLITLDSKKKSVIAALTSDHLIFTGRKIVSVRARFSFALNRNSIRPANRLIVSVPAASWLKDCIKG